MERKTKAEEVVWLETDQLEELLVVEVLNTKVIFCHRKILERRQQRVDAHEKEGKHDGMLRERREFKVDQSLRG